MIIAFAGIHGSGKSTYAKFTYNLLKKKDITQTHIVDLSFLGLLRTLFFGKAKRENPKVELQKEFSESYFIFTRFFLYWLDLVIFWFYSLRFKKKKILLCDRYFHDKITNFNLSNPFFKFYWKIYDLFLPKPDIIFFIDVSANEAHKRKPEYHLNFFVERHKSYSLIKGDIKNKIILDGSLIKNKALIKKTLTRFFRD